MCLYICIQYIFLLYPVVIDKFNRIPLVHLYAYEVLLFTYHAISVLDVCKYVIYLPVSIAHQLISGRCCKHDANTAGHGL